ncbi:magnesium transporter CorA family protein [Haloplasma contractile]|uniref:Magnesium protein n=1 Tax=Haloplasma contractile SSD-17B TaxID=1033810 RepID=U2DY80_9MOLU|nr:magnesium transporter CorA family protein [Haloplasma contractile]ERJ13217.1 Magnesium protein [Haloplasma contractile SSD-17B]
MIKIYNIRDNTLKEQGKFTKGSWINVVNPTKEEIDTISTYLYIDEQDIESVLDADERARIEVSRNYGVIIVDVPIASAEKNEIYQTIPIAIFFTEEYILTVCVEELPLLEKMIKDSSRKDINTSTPNLFILQFLYNNSILYLNFLRKIDKKSREVEKELNESLSNSELLHLLALEKSLVFFKVSLKSLQPVLEKMTKLTSIQFTEEEKALLEDVIIEHNQAVEMTEIYSGVLNGMLNTSASIISNNLNNVMKTLTSITLIISIPTVIGSFYGMNVLLPIQDDPFAFIYILLGSTFMSLILTIILIKKKLF